MQTCQSNRGAETLYTQEAADGANATLETVLAVQPTGEAVRASALQCSWRPNDLACVSACSLSIVFKVDMNKA